MSPTPILYIRISSDDLTLARSIGQKTLVFRHRLNRRVSFTLNLREALAEAPAAITAEATQAQVYVTAPVSVIPIQEFSESEAPAHHAATFRPEHKSRILCDGIPTLESVLVYAIPENVCHALEDSFPHTRYHNALTPMLQRGSLSVNEEYTVLAYAHEDKTDVIMWEGRKLLALNTFTTKHTDDAVFFILGMAQALGIPAENLRSVVVGDNRMRTALIEALSRFLTTEDGDVSNTFTTRSSDIPLPYPLACALAISQASANKGTR